MTACGLCCRQAAIGLNLFFQYSVGHTVAQCKDFKKSQVWRPLLTTALQTATFSYWDTVPSLYILRFINYKLTFLSTKESDQHPTYVHLAFFIVQQQTTQYTNSHDEVVPRFDVGESWI